MPFRIERTWAWWIRLCCGCYSFWRKQKCSMRNGIKKEEEAVRRMTRTKTLSWFMKKKVLVVSSKNEEKREETNKHTLRKKKTDPLNWLFNAEFIGNSYSNNWELCCCKWSIWTCSFFFYVCWYRRSYPRWWKQKKSSNLRCAKMGIASAHTSRESNIHTRARRKKKLEPKRATEKFIREPEVTL